MILNYLYDICIVFNLMNAKIKLSLFQLLLLMLLRTVKETDDNIKLLFSNQFKSQIIFSIHSQKTFLSFLDLNRYIIKNNTR